MALLTRTRVEVTAAMNGLLLLSLACGASALASDSQPSSRIAAVSPSATPLLERRDRTQSDDEAWLLAQGAPMTAATGVEILATFHSSAPETVEEEVAKAHGLELISRMTLDSLRIVRFRILDARSVRAVVAVLRADQRVNSAQANFIYQLPEQPETAISDLKQPPPANQEKGPASTLRQGDVALLKNVQPKHAARLNIAKSTEAIRPGKGRVLQSGGSLVAGNHTSLRWPTADEPFVSVGARNR